MMRRMNLRWVLVAAAFFGLGFFVADRMTSAGASAPAVPQENGGSAFSGTEGAVVVKSQLVVIRGPKIYRIDPFGPGGLQRPWGTLGE